MTRACWTPSGAEEVTVNIFTLHALHLVFGHKPPLLQSSRLSRQLLHKHASVHNFSFRSWSQNPAIGLVIFSQLIHSFGWNAFKIIFREYESLGEKEKLLDRSDAAKWDEWITRFSNIVGLDVSPLFYFWSVPFTEKTSANLNDLTPWLANDEVSKMFGDRVAHVKKNYNGLLYGNEGLYSGCPKVMYDGGGVEGSGCAELDLVKKMDGLLLNKISSF